MGESFLVPVRLRDHLEAKADAEAQRVNMLFLLALAAVAFAWTEIQRRLGVLNHAHETAQEVAKSTVRQDIYDQSKAEQDKRLGALETEQARVRAGRTATFAVIAAVGALVTTVVLVTNGGL